MPVHPPASLRRLFAPDGRSALRRTVPVLIAAALLFSFISISCAQVFWGLAFLAWLAGLIRKEWRWRVPGFFWPLPVYAALSLVAAALSVNPELSFLNCKNILLFLVIPLIATGLTSVEDVGLAARAVLASAVVGSVYSLGYAVFKAAPEQRISGFAGHYMTQGGLLFLFGGLALSLIFFGKGRERILWAGAFALSTGALVLTYTRCAWVGLGAALIFLLALWKPKALIALPVLVILAFVASPSSIRHRALSIFNPAAFSNHLRIEYLRAGVKIIRDYPLHGTGPDTVDLVFQDAKYGLSEAAKKNVHLHNNLAQIAAERGLPTLVVWLAFMVWMFVACLRLLKDKASPLYVYAAAAAALIPAFFLAGLFEYNFGDSEVLTLFLALAALPFAGRSARPASQPGKVVR
jgi:O-antigen ligase